MLKALKMCQGVPAKVHVSKLSLYPPPQMHHTSKLHFQCGPAIFCAKEEFSKYKQLIKCVQRPLLHHACYNSHSVTNNWHSREEEVKLFLAKHTIKHSKGPSCYHIACSCETDTQPDQQLYVNKITGFYTCFHCKQSGTWEQLKSAFLEQQQADSTTVPSLCMKQHDKEDETKVVPALQEVRDVWDSSAEISSVDIDALSKLLLRLGLQSLTPDTLAKFHVRVKLDEDKLILPSYSYDGCIVSVRVVWPTTNIDDCDSHTEFNNNLRSIETLPARSHSDSVRLIGLFGSHLLSSTRSRVVITNCEFDAMIIHQVTSKLAVTLPSSASPLPQQLLPLLEPFSQITFWFGSTGNTSVLYDIKQFSMKLADRRCHIVKSELDSPSPLQVYESGSKKQLMKMLAGSRSIAHKDITNFSAIRRDVYKEFFNAKELAGVQWQRFPRLNELLLGHRPGELTIITGPTGSGKTTLVSEYALDLCEQGVNTLWGSFEISNQRLMKTMLMQFAKKDLTVHTEEFHEWSQKFEKLPMFFMTFHGHEDIHAVIEAMSHAVYAHNTSHVIIDNLQFMLEVRGTGSLDRFLQQDIVIAAFRKFATIQKCHVSLVVHPRKEAADENLTIASVFGGVKATQEADNVLILQKDPQHGSKYLEIVKNRFSGDLGRMSLLFNRETKSFCKQPKTTVKKSYTHHASQYTDYNSEDDDECAGENSTDSSLFYTMKGDFK